jgi:hypothetical protein
MIRKLITCLLLSLCLTSAFASTGEKNCSKKSNKFRIDELVVLPHPGKHIKKGHIQISQEQKQRFMKEVKAVYPPIFQAKMQAAYKLQKRSNAVSKREIAQKNSRPCWMRLPNSRGRP